MKMSDLSYLDLQLEAKLLKYQEERGDGVVDDNAAIPIHLWNNRIAIGLNRIRWERPNGNQEPNQNPYFNFDGDKGMTKFTALQPKMLKRWKSNVQKSFKCWYKTTGRHMPHATEILADGLTGFRLWRQYWRQYWGYIFSGHISLKNRTYCPLFSHDSTSFKDTCLFIYLK
jgi:hypothetical protein